MELLEELLEHKSLRSLSIINAKLLGDENFTIEGTKQPRFRFSTAMQIEGGVTSAMKALVIAFQSILLNIEKILIQESLRVFQKHSMYNPKPPIYLPF